MINYVTVWCRDLHSVLCNLIFKNRLRVTSVHNKIPVIIIKDVIYFNVGMFIKSITSS